jgi:hypothetical protein
MGYYKNVANAIDYEWSIIFQVKCQGRKNKEIITHHGETWKTK